MQVFGEMTYDDLWEDAEMVSVVTYLRGSKTLCVPEAWRPLLPKCL